MSLDKVTKDFGKVVVRQLSNIVGRLDQLVGIANRPRQDCKQSISPKSTPTQEDSAAIGKMLLLKDIKTTQQQEQQSKAKWYKTLQGWKTLFELVAIPFAVAYAIITYLQWGDLRRNFANDERA